MDRECVLIQRVGVGWVAVWMLLLLVLLVLEGCVSSTTAPTKKPYSAFYQYGDYVSNAYGTQRIQDLRPQEIREFKDQNGRVMWKEIVDERGVWHHVY